MGGGIYASAYEDVIEEYTWHILDKLDDGKITLKKAEQLVDKLYEWERKFEERRTNK